MVKNRRGIAPAMLLLVVIGIIAGFFVAKQVGLFSIYAPPQSDTSLNNIVNKYYYPATNVGPASCQTLTNVVLRATFPFTTTTMPSNGAQIAVFDGNTLVAKKTDSSSLSSQAGTCESKVGTNFLFSSGNVRVYAIASGYTVCVQQTSTTYGVRDFTSTVGLTIPTGLSPVSGYSESTKTVETKDAGTYARSGSNIITQYCGTFGSTIVESCALGSEYIAGYNIGGNNFINAVKCQGIYKANQQICGSNGKTIYKTDSTGNTLTVDNSYYACVNNQGIDCKEGSAICTNNLLPTKCINGKWVNQVTCSGLETCKQGGSAPDTTAVCSSNYVDGEQQCSGKQPVIYRATLKNFENNGPACATSCQLQSGVTSCVNQCTADTCEAGTLFSCKVQSSGNLKTQLAVCNSGQCNTDAKTCKPQYTLDKSYCFGSNIAKGIPDATSTQKVTGGVLLQTIQTCKLGPDDCSGTPVCKEIPACVGKENKNVCTDNTKLGQCSAAGDEILSSSIIDCTTQLSNPDATCDQSSGSATCKAPVSQCTNDFCSGDAVFSCNAGKVGTQKYSCNNLGCNTNTNQCNSEPSSSLNTYKCQITSGTHTDSFKGVFNSTSNQYYYTLDQTCSAEGCNTNGGKCFTTGKVNTFVCQGSYATTGLGGKIFQTDANGQKIIPEKADCSALTSNGLQAFCVEGQSSCNYCYQDLLYCGNKERYACANPLTGDKKNVESCPAGCFEVVSGSGISKLCDDIRILPDVTTNFRPGENVIVRAQLKGSQTGYAIQSACTSSLLSSGVSEAGTCVVQTDGSLLASFGTKPIGEYNATITLANYPGSIISQTVRVTDDYKIKIYGSQTVFKIPGATTKATVITEGNGVPDGIVKSNVPSNITVEVVPGLVSGQWDLILDGSPGVYYIGLKANKGGVSQPEQQVAVEIVTPKIKVKTTITSATVKGTKGFDFQIVGPTSTKSEDNIKPDTISATISHSPAVPLTLVDLGGGRYTTDYNFADNGVYTINVVATKSGYDLEPFSFAVTVSDAGLVNAPGTTGNSNSTTTTGVTNLPVIGGVSTSTILIILAIVGILYWVIKGRKR